MAERMRGDFLLSESSNDLELQCLMIDVLSSQDINFWGSVYTTRFAVPHLRNSRGKIIALASSASWLPAPRMSFYNVSNVFTIFLAVGNEFLCMSCHLRQAKQQW
jgi:hypothetical protein